MPQILNELPVQRLSSEAGGGGVAVVVSSIAAAWRCFRAAVGGVDQPKPAQVTIVGIARPDLLAAIFAPATGIVSHRAVAEEAHSRACMLAASARLDLPECLVVFTVSATRLQVAQMDEIVTAAQIRAVINVRGDIPRSALRAIRKVTARRDIPHLVVT